jgi:hypothetical protein
MITYPQVQPTPNNTYRVLSPYKYGNVTVPKGYETNGADVPRPFWSFVPPFKPKYLPAVIVHDYLCSKKDYQMADKYFEKMLTEIGLTYETKAMIAAVKLYTKYIRKG